MWKYDQIQETTSYLTEKCPEKPELAIILGSGLGSLTDTLEDKLEIPYSDTPHFAMSTAHGQST